MIPVVVGVNMNIKLCAPPPSIHLRPSRGVSVSNLKVIPSRVVVCRAQLLHDAPFALAMGASIFNSLLFPLVPSDLDGEDEDEDEDEDLSSAFSSTDARFAVMTLISFIPYFNCLSWVFALMDTGKPRYGVYALVYLAPYLRTNLSLSPDDSWLPISSILLCILHIQLEASITSGDLQSFNFFNEIWKRLGFIDLRRPTPTNLTNTHQQERSQNTLGQHQSKDEITNRRVPRKPFQDIGHVNDDINLDDETKH